MIPRGVRNANPGNLRMSPSLWQGKIPNIENTDGAFEQFKEMKWGIRALMKLLIGYVNNGCSTIEKIISRYAPSNENNTEAYIKSVCDRTGFERDEILTPDEGTIKRLVYAISYHENGGDYLKIGDVEDAWGLI